MIIQHLWAIHLACILSILYSVSVLPVETLGVIVVISMVIAPIIVEVGLHRYFTHRSFRVPWITHWILLVTCTFGAQGPVGLWVASHKNHHKFSDTERDDHSPKIVGFWGSFFAHWGWMAQLRYGDQLGTMLKRRGLLYTTHRFVRITTDYYVLVLAGFMLCLFVIAPTVYFAYAWLVVIMLIGEGITNSVGHKTGTHVDNRSLTWCLFWTGVPYHHYHHTRPYEYKMHGFFDPAGWFIDRIRTPN